jgi:hypothetical protein
MSDTRLPKADWTVFVIADGYVIGRDVRNRRPYKSAGDW